MYTAAVWQEMMEPELTGNILDERTANLNVRFRRGRVSTKMDSKQGRVTLDEQLLRYAGIEQDVVAVRAGKYWRLMSPKVAESF